MQYDVRSFELTDLEVCTLLELRQWSKRLGQLYVCISWSDGYGSYWFDRNTRASLELLMNNLGIEKRSGMDNVARYLHDAGLLNVTWYDRYCGSHPDYYKICRLDTIFAGEHFCRKLERNLYSKRVISSQEVLTPSTFKSAWDKCRVFVLEVIAWTFGSADEPQLSNGLKELI